MLRNMERRRARLEALRKGEALIQNARDTVHSGLDIVGVIGKRRSVWFRFEGAKQQALQGS